MGFQNGEIALQARLQGSQRGGAVAQQRTFLGQFGQSRVSRPGQHDAGQPCFDRGARCLRQSRGGQQFEYLAHLAGLDQPGQIGFFGQRLAAQFMTVTPQGQRFLEHSLGSQRLGATGVAGGKSIDPERPPLPLDQLFVKLGRLLETTLRHLGLGLHGQRGTIQGLRQRFAGFWFAFA